MFNLIFLLFNFAHASELVVWNVGQGQWATESHETICLHYDLGGEINVSARALKLCHQKKNILFLSHWDWDHISFVARFAAKVKDVCLWKLPLGKTSSWKTKYIQKIPLCRDEDRILTSRYIYSLTDEKIFNLKKRKINPNDLSLVYQSSFHHVIFPGDSPLQKERLWIDQIRAPVQGLVLGHHGSKTSTSKALLDQLPNLQWAVASARKRKYGHPHDRVIRDLKKIKIPLLKTEDWGHLHFMKTSL